MRGGPRGARCPCPPQSQGSPFPPLVPSLSLYCTLWGARFLFAPHRPGNPFIAASWRLVEQGALVRAAHGTECSGRFLPNGPECRQGGRAGRDGALSGGPAPGTPRQGEQGGGPRPPHPPLPVPPPSYGRVYAAADPYHHAIGPTATYSIGTMVRGRASLALGPGCDEEGTALWPGRAGRPLGRPRPLTSDRGLVAGRTKARIGTGGDLPLCDLAELEGGQRALCGAAATAPCPEPGHGRRARPPPRHQAKQRERPRQAPPPRVGASAAGAPAPCGCVRARPVSRHRRHRHAAPSLTSVGEQEPPVVPRPGPLPGPLCGAGPGLQALYSGSRAHPPQPCLQPSGGEEGHRPHGPAVNTRSPARSVPQSLPVDTCQLCPRSPPSPRRVGFQLARRPASRWKRSGE